MVHWSSSKVMDTQILNWWGQFHEIYFVVWGKTPGFYMFPWQSLSIRGNFRKVMQASGMVCLLQGWQLPSAGVAEAPAATSCYSPQIHWVSVRAKSGEFSPNIQPPPNLSTLQQIQFWRSFFKYSSVSSFKTISLPFSLRLITRSRFNPDQHK